MKSKTRAVFTKLFAVPLATGLMLGHGTLAQAPKSARQSASLPAFEVVSVRPSKPGGTGGRVRLLPDGVRYQDATLQLVLRQAFGVQEAQIVDAPGWITSDPFDIEAKVQPSDETKLKDLKPNQRWPMILPVLEDRFGLKYHRESRALPFYALVIAKGGLKIKEAAAGDTYANGLKGPGGGPGGPGLMMMHGKIIAQGITIAMLLDSLSTQALGRPLIDKTGLTGKYDFTFQWIPDSAADPAGSASAPTTEAPGPSLFTALEEELGLKLEALKGEVPVVVIDHLDRQPTPN